MSFRPGLTFRRLRRYPLAWWLLVVFVAGVTGYAVTASVASAESSAGRFDGMVAVAVFTRDLPAGSVLTPADFRTETRPRAFLPKVPPVLSPTGRTVVVPVSSGDVVHELNAGARGLSPTAALIEPEDRAIALSLQGLHPSLVVGDRVDVLATFERDDALTEPTAVISQGAKVVQLNDDSVMVAVSSEDAKRVAFAATKGSVVLALSSAVPAAGTSPE